MGVYEGKNMATTRKNRYGTSHRNSFEDIGKNLNIIARRLMQDHPLMKLLIHTEPNAESMDLTQEQIEGAFNDQIRIIPVINKDEKMKNYVIIQFGSFTPVKTPHDYKQYVVTFDIICNTAATNWMLKDYNARPFKIMSRIDELINQTKIDSIGPVQFLGAQQLIVNEELSGFTLSYIIMTEQ